MTCATCEKPIRPGQLYDSYPIATASGGGTVVYYHRECRLPRKPAPVH